MQPSNTCIHLRRFSHLHSMDVPSSFLLNSFFCSALSHNFSRQMFRLFSDNSFSLVLTHSLLTLFISLSLSFSFYLSCHSRTHPFFLSPFGYIFSSSSSSLSLSLSLSLSPFSSICFLPLILSIVHSLSLSFSHTLSLSLTLTLSLSLSLSAISLN